MPLGSGPLFSQLHTCEQNSENEGGGNTILDPVTVIEDCPLAVSCSILRLVLVTGGPLHCQVEHHVR